MRASPGLDGGAGRRGGGGGLFSGGARDQRRRQGAGPMNAQSAGRGVGRVRLAGCPAGQCEASLKRERQRQRPRELFLCRARARGRVSGRRRAPLESPARGVACPAGARAAARRRRRVYISSGARSPDASRRVALLLVTTSRPPPGAGRTLRVAVQLPPPAPLPTVLPPRLRPPSLLPAHDASAGSSSPRPRAPPPPFLSRAAGHARLGLRLGLRRQPLGQLVVGQLVQHAHDRPVLLRQRLRPDRQGPEVRGVQLVSEEQHGRQWRPQRSGGPPAYVAAAVPPLSPPDVTNQPSQTTSEPPSTSASGASPTRRRPCPARATSTTGATLSRPRSRRTTRTSASRRNTRIAPRQTAASWAPTCSRVYNATSLARRSRTLPTVCPPATSPRQHADRGNSPPHAPGRVPTETGARPDAESRRRPVQQHAGKHHGADARGADGHGDAGRRVSGAEHRRAHRDGPRLSRGGRGVLRGRLRLLPQAAAGGSAASAPGGRGARGGGGGGGVLGVEGELESELERAVVQTRLGEHGGRGGRGGRSGRSGRGRP